MSDLDYVIFESIFLMDQICFIFVTIMFLNVFG